MPSKQGEKDKDASTWYNNELQEIPEDMLSLLESYSGVPRQKAVQHILTIVSGASFTVYCLRTRISLSSVLVCVTGEPTITSMQKCIKG